LNAELSPKQKEAFRSAVARSSYRLTFGKTEKSRRFLEDGLDGPFIPNAYRDDDSEESGDWEQKPSFAVNGKYIEGSGASPEDWLAHFLSMAINEAVHEALEYFRVDDKPYLDPHGKREQEIYLLVNELAANLAEIAEEEK
jgi:hypothetical protein